MNTLRQVTLSLSVMAVVATPVAATAEGEVNLYSSRHYNTDERLYSDFEKATGIKVNRIEDKADALIERMSAEGANSPADVLITVDASRLYRADQASLFQSIESDALNSAVPSELRHPEGHYFGFSKRARVIFYDKADVSEPPQTYADLADPKYKGQVCARSSTNVYMQSLLAAMIKNDGEAAAKSWAAGLYANFARAPQGGDTDQLRAIVSGECDIVLSNTYYFARSLASDVKGLTGSTDGIGIVFPNQESTGTHVNISGAGVAAHAPNRDNAIKFLEYLASPQAQAYFAEGNHEYPVVEGASQSSVLDSMGSFKSDTGVTIFDMGQNQARATEIYDEVGYP